MAELFHEVQRSHKPGRKRPVFFIVFRPFGSDCITAVFHRIVNECKRSDTRLSGRLRPLLTVHDTIKTVLYAPFMVIVMVGHGVIEFVCVPYQSFFLVLFLEETF
jgi:hypothetical protein